MIEVTSTLFVTISPYIFLVKVDFLFITWIE